MSGRVLSARRGLWQPVARTLLWVILLFVAVRGVGDILAGGERAVPAASIALPAAAGWPSDEARAFAINFARAYLTYSPRHPEYHKQAVEPMLAADLRANAAISVPQNGPTQTVDQAAVARTERLDGNRALLTVACVVFGKTVTTRYLTVPVARDGRGGLAVFDYPSFTSPPPAASVSADAKADEESLTGPDAEPIESLLRRFFPVYLSGRGDQLSYFVATGAQVPPLEQNYEVVDLVSVSQEGKQGGARRRVLAVVRARDHETDAVYTLRYRLSLSRGDRWLVSRIEG
jgi:Conjugative transposon protein TcpC